MLNEVEQMIERYDEPTEGDTACQFCTCFVKKDSSVWVQSSKIEDHPRWLRFDTQDEAQSFIDEMKLSN